MKKLIWTLAFALVLVLAGGSAHAESSACSNQYCEPDFNGNDVVGYHCEDFSTNTECIIASGSTGCTEQICGTGGGGGGGGDDDEDDDGILGGLLDWIRDLTGLQDLQPR